MTDISSYDNCPSRTQRLRTFLHKFNTNPMKPHGCAIESVHERRGILQIKWNNIRSFHDYAYIANYLWTDHLHEVELEHSIRGSQDYIEYFRGEGYRF